MVVDLISSSSSSSSPSLSIPIQPPFQDLQSEYVPDPEDHQQPDAQQPPPASNLPATPASLPQQLLKIHAREMGLILRFELDGNLLESVRPRPGGAQTGSSLAESNLNPAKYDPNPRHHEYQQRDLPTIPADHTGPARRKLGGGRSDGREESTLVSTADDYVFVSVRPRVTSRSAPDKTLTNSASKPIIYFAETRTVRHMHELCSSEAVFQQQVTEKKRKKGRILAHRPLSPLVLPLDVGLFFFCG